MLHCRFKITQWLHGNIVKVLQGIANLSIHQARVILPLVPILSIAVFCLGLFTNFHLETNRVKLWTPKSSPAIEHSQWITEESGFPSKTYPIHVLLHANGGNVITVDAVDTLFQAVVIFQETEGYDNLCGRSSNSSSLFPSISTSIVNSAASLDTAPAEDSNDTKYYTMMSSAGNIGSDSNVSTTTTTTPITSAATNNNDNSLASTNTRTDSAKNSTGATCSLLGVTNFFNDDYDVFREKVKNDEDLIASISTFPFLPDGRIVQRNRMFGYIVVENADPHENLVIGAKSLKLRLGLPQSAATKIYEKKAIQNLLEFRSQLRKMEQDDLVGKKKGKVLQHEDATRQEAFHIEVLSLDSYTDETERAVFNDLPLIPAMILIMCGFSCLVYYKRDQVQSSCLLLGIGAVLTVLFSLLTSFGLLFLIGVPFSSLTASTPFIILGIGLDDAFIITGAYQNTNHNESFETRISSSIHDCGISIFLTTLTTVIAFSLGTMSQVPAMKNFYIYAATCVFVDFIYQVSFFIVLLYMNEKRKEQQRYDWIFCFKQKSSIPAVAQVVENNPNIETRGSYCDEGKPHQLLRWYCNLLEKYRSVRFMIIAAFLGLASVSVYSGSKLRVAFDVTSLVPSNSYINFFVTSLETYAEQDPYVSTAFFRDVDFSSSAIQTEMNQYINDLVNLPQISSYPQHFWLKDFQQFIETTNRVTNDLSFEEQLDIFLDDEYFKVLYSNLIVRDHASNHGTMTASAVILPLDNLNLNNVRDQVDFLSRQETISRNANHELQSLSVSGQTKRHDRTPFFTFSEDYFMWEFYAVAVHELLMSTVASVVAVAVITFLLIPRISALCIVIVSVLIIYMDVLGLMYWSGFSINPVTLIAILMSIGLMVDYVLHIVMRCFEYNENITQQQQDQQQQEEDITKDDINIYHCLSTIGVSVMIGGASTVLSTIPLAFSTSEIFFSIFVIFFGFVVFSLLHGLIFLPAILASFQLNHHEGQDHETGIMTTSSEAATTPLDAEEEDERHEEQS